MGRRRGGNYIYLAILIPHRDCRALLRFRSAALFASGLPGAWSFPHVAPLALLSAPLGVEELAVLAGNLRRRSLEDNRGGMIAAGGERALSLEVPEGFPGLTLYGPALELRFGAEDFGPEAEKKIRALFPPLLGCAVLGDEGAPEKGGAGGPAFRAAAVANMRLCPLPAGERGYSFSWNFGKPRWLPPCRAGFRLPGEGR
jgi:hypothetical protein